MSNNSSQISIAIDGNEANITNRVGSNVYAFEIIKAIEKITKEDSTVSVTVLLRNKPIAALPKERDGWKYQVVGPSPYWTQWALPIHLFLNQRKYDVLYTPSHYAPRLSAVPYVSSVMDLAFLKFPDQFHTNDYLQLKHWTKYSVAHAKKVIVISEATKADVIDVYKKNADDVVIAYPAVSQPNNNSQSQPTEFIKKHHLKEPYFLFVGTLQPRKNIVSLVEAYELLCRKISSSQTKKKTSFNKKGSVALPQLVLAGKVGWLAEGTLDRIKQSPFFDYIIMPGFVSSQEKTYLYQHASASVLIGLYEGFGIPALESIKYGCVPVVSNSSSLPEVVGEAGVLVDPLNTKNISYGLEKTLFMTAKQKALFRRKGREQLKKFSWEKSADIVLSTLQSVAHK